MGIRLAAESETSLVYALSITELCEHPLRLQTRKKMRLSLPAGVSLNRLGELDCDDRGNQIGVDLGVVISARRALDYEQTEWLSDLHDVQPKASESEVIVEYSAHPDARLFLRADDGTIWEKELSALADMDQAMAIALNRLLCRSRQPPGAYD
ncbi:hypothetical protein NKH36_31290 [Mesorhizobium sp. M1312]|uniref:hypothetical protein n=1 Tax=unclassified Mesorhizobium TaxID=325217 RepID=UPI00333976F9